MSDTHAETALWIDGLKKRADGAERRIAATDPATQDRKELDDRLARFRKGVDLMGNSGGASDKERSTLDRMADDLDDAVEKFLAKFN